MLAEPGPVVLDFDEAENVGPGSLAALPDGGADLRFEQSEEAFGRGVGIRRRMRSLPALTTDVCG
jgi:hypothetical protein